MDRSWIKKILEIAAFTVLAYVLWSLRSWNLEIGDGEFCCKQTAGAAPYAVTLSRAPLSHLAYRWLFFTMRPLLGWWVEDCIALSSCAAGLVFFWALYRLSCLTFSSFFERAILILFCSSTLVFQIFCGHIEFYPWTCALLMVAAYWSWRCVQGRMSPLWPSAAMALSAAFHSSGVFYFPALLLLPLFINVSQNEQISFSKTNVARIGIFFGLFLVTALLHRSPWIYLPCLGIGAFCVFTYHSKLWKKSLHPWWMIYLPWLVLFTARAAFFLRPEPLLEHLPPVFEPYDHGAYLYDAFSWDHLYDKVMFHFWLAPYGLAGLFIFGISYWRKMIENRWLLFLFHFSLWALIWTTLFYPQLRTRDWDLFATMAAPLNLFTLYACYTFLKPGSFRILTTLMILTQLTITAPVVIDNSGIFSNRGYAVLRYEPEPIPADAFLRGLKLGTSPLELRYARAGWAVIGIVPQPSHREYLPWGTALDLLPGEEYIFSPTLKKRPVFTSPE